MHFFGSLIVAVVVPCVIVGLGSIAKKLASKQKWEHQHWFFGIELCVAALADEAANFGGMMLKCYERWSHNLAMESSTLGWALFVAVFFVLNFFILLVVMGFHQDYEVLEAEDERSVSQRFNKLVLKANGLGFMFLAVFLLAAQYIPAA